MEIFQTSDSHHPGNLLFNGTDFNFIFLITIKRSELVPSNVKAAATKENVHHKRIEQLESVDGDGIKG